MLSVFYDEASILQADGDTVATQPDVPLTRKVGPGNSKGRPFKQNKTADPLNQNNSAVSVWALISPWDYSISPQTIWTRLLLNYLEVNLDVQYLHHHTTLFPYYFMSASLCHSEAHSSVYIKSQSSS